jgi:hypothetical protein
VSTLKVYPSPAEIAEKLGEGEIATRVAAMLETNNRYQVRRELVRISMDLTPVTLSAMAHFLNDIRGDYPSAVMDSDHTIYIDKTDEELAAQVISDECQKRYYHPEDYPKEYTAKDIKD